MFTIVCTNTRILWVFTTASKISPDRIIYVILTTLNNEKHPFRCIRVEKDGALTNSTSVSNLLVNEFIISMENTGGGASCLNVNNGRHNRIIHSMVR